MFSIHKFKTVDSTNKLAREYPFNSVIIAKEQSKGKGRFTRKWASPKGGLWISIVLNPKKRPFEYTFIASLAVLKSMDIEAAIKWPNDIIYSKKKVCGILTEVITQGKKNKVIIGIGINVNNKIPKEIKKKAISLREIKNTETDLDSLMQKILKNFEEIMRLDSKELLREYRENCSTLGKKIRITTMGKTIGGFAKNIDKEGRLILETESGKLILNEGEVSVL